jgi:hypothetical protein
VTQQFEPIIGSGGRQLWPQPKRTLIRAQRFGMGAECSRRLGRAHRPVIRGPEVTDGVIVLRECSRLGHWGQLDRFLDDVYPRYVKLPTALQLKISVEQFRQQWVNKPPFASGPPLQDRRVGCLPQRGIQLHSQTGLGADCRKHARRDRLTSHRDKRADVPRAGVECGGKSP